MTTEPDDPTASHPDTSAMPDPEPSNNREVAAALAGRLITPTEAVSLPDTLMRRLLVAAFGVEATSSVAGYDNEGPMPLELVDVEGVPNNPKIFPLPYSNSERRQAATLLHYLSDSFGGSSEDDDIGPDELALLVAPPLIGAHASIVGLAILYEDWAYPPGHPADDTREPGDVPDSTPARIVKGVTTDRVLFTVTRRHREQPTARVELLGSDAEDVATSPDRVRDALLRALPCFVTAYTRYASGPLPAAATDHDATACASKVTMEVRGHHLLSNLGYDEVDALPDSEIRTLALAALDVAARHHDTCLWDASQGPYVLRHTRHSVSPETRGNTTVIEMPIEDGDVEEMLMNLARQATHDDEVRVQLQKDSKDYLAVSLLAETWVSDNPSKDRNRPVADTPGAYEAMYLLCVTRRGAMLYVIHPRGGRPRVSIAMDIDAAARRFQLDGVTGLHALNKIFIDLDPNTSIPAEPTAEIAELPSRADVGDNKFVLLPVRWRNGEPRHGAIFPPLPEDHPLAHERCACPEPLANGTPVQTLVLNPKNPEDVDLFHSGEWCDAYAALLHQTCVDGIAAQFAPVVFAVHRTWAHRVAHH